MTKKSKIANTFLRKLAKFGRNKGGQVAMTFGLAAVPIVGATGIAFDFTRKIEAQVTTQAALDGAAMAATAALNAGENEETYTQAAQDFFDRNKPDNLIGNPEIEIEVSYAKATLVAKTDAAIKTTMTKILGYDTMPLKNDHQGTGEDGEEGGSFGTTIALPAFTVERKGEIAMVMDYSGSMNWYLGGERKYVTMRNEAAKLVTALSQAKTNDYVKFGVVPFSSEVFAEMKNKYWHGYTGEQKRSSCTRDRNYPYNLEATEPTQPGNPTSATRFGKVASEWSSNPYSWWFYQGWENYRYNCSSYSGYRNLVVQDLTKNHNDTYNKILAMRPYGNTHIAVGMEFGYHLLSPNAPFTEGASYGASDTEKAVILLTDGAQTTRAFGAGNSYSTTNGRNNLATLCTRMKADGIRILTVSYDLYDSDTENRLRNCASDVNDFYDADSKPELVAAFSNITAKLAQDMYLAK